jgi:hypothetical protein
MGLAGFEAVNCRTTITITLTFIPIEVSIYGTFSGDVSSGPAQLVTRHSVRLRA